MSPLLGLREVTNAPSLVSPSGSKSGEGCCSLPFGGLLAGSRRGWLSWHWGSIPAEGPAAFVSRGRALQPGPPAPVTASCLLGWRRQVTAGSLRPGSCLPASEGCRGAALRPQAFDEGCRNKGLSGEPWGPGRTIPDFVLGWVGVQGRVDDKDKRCLSSSLSGAPLPVREGWERTLGGLLLTLLCLSGICHPRAGSRVESKFGSLCLPSWGSPHLSGLSCLLRGRGLPSLPAATPSLPETSSHKGPRNPARLRGRWQITAP